MREYLCVAARVFMRAFLSLCASIYAWITLGANRVIHWEIVLMAHRVYVAGLVLKLNYPH